MSDSRHHGRIDRKQRQPAKPAAIDRRAARTRQALHSALIALIQRKDYEAISVQDIVDAADVGRSTFYAHFTGKDDLLKSGGDWLRTLLTGHGRHGGVSSESVGDGAAPLLGFSLALFAHTREQRALYSAMVAGRAGTIVLGMMRDVLAETVRAELAAHADVPPPRREVAVQYIVGGLMSVLTWWLDRGAKEPPEQMEAAFRSLALRGLGGRAGAETTGSEPSRRHRRSGHD